MDLFDELSATWLRETFIAGVDLTLDNGDPYPDALFDQAIRSAARIVGRELKIAIEEEIVEDERHDSEGAGADGWWTMRLDRYPLIEVEQLQLQWGDFDPTEIPASWIQVSERALGWIRLMPSGDALGGLGFVGVMPFFGFFKHHGIVPDAFRIEYRAGFQCQEGELDGITADGTYTVEMPSSMQDGKYRTGVRLLDATGACVPKVTTKVVKRTRRRASFEVAVSGLPDAGPYTIDWWASELPEDIMQAIGLTAAMLPLDVAGDLILGAGIANMSIGVDGLHQSIGTTSSATNAGYGARIKSFQAQLKTLLPLLKARYARPSWGWM